MIAVHTVDFVRPKCQPVAFAVANQQAPARGLLFSLSYAGDFLQSQDGPELDTDQELSPNIY